MINKGFERLILLKNEITNYLKQNETKETNRNAK